MTVRFEGRRVFVTGAASGVGRATAQLFAAEGGRVFAVDVNGDGLEGTLDAIRKAGGSATGGRCDIASKESVEASIGAAVGALGGLDILVNVAAIGRAARLEEVEEEEWTRTISINLGGVYRTTRAAMPHLLERPGGNIVNVASISALRGQAYNSLYCASKAGMLNFTRSIALEFTSRGLRANCVCPSGILTPLIRNFQPRADFEKQLLAYYSPPIEKRMADPEDIAKAIAFLASEDARMVNGAAFVVDGGTLA